MHQDGSIYKRLLKKCLNYLYVLMYTGKWKVILDCSNFRTDFWGFVNSNRKFIIISRSSHICDTSSFTDFYKRKCQFALNLSLQDFIPPHETLSQSSNASQDMFKRFFRRRPQRKFSFLITQP